MLNLESKDLKVYMPDMKLCTDNAAMIGCAAYPLYLKKDFTDYSLNAQSALDLF